MAERVLTQRELNRATLARQLLLRRERLPVARAVERLGALQAQWPPSPFLALWSRLDGFRREHLAEAVERRRVVKATLMRTTLHHVSARDYLGYARLYLDARILGLERRLLREGIELDVETLVDRIRAQTVNGPRSRPELLEELGIGKLVATDPRPWLIWHLLAARTPLLHAPESSRWRRTT